SGVAKLPEDDRRWLADARFRLLVPIVARDGSLLGLIGLGEKKSGLHFLKEDKKLLVEIASAAALGIELERKAATATGSRDSENDLLSPFLEERPPRPQPPENAKE